MGRLVYDSSLEADFDDRLLAHLQVVIGSKLGKNESFYFSWRNSAGAGNGRTSLWLHPAVALRFTYQADRPTSINNDWVRRMIADSHRGAGLRITEEPPPPASR